MLRTNLIVIALLASLLTSAHKKIIFTRTNVSHPELKTGFGNTPAEAPLHCYR